MHNWKCWEPRFSNFYLNHTQGIHKESNRTVAAETKFASVAFTSFCHLHFILDGPYKVQHLTVPNFHYFARKGAQFTWNFAHREPFSLFFSGIPRRYPLFTQTGDKNCSNFWPRASPMVYSWSQWDLSRHTQVAQSAKRIQPEGGNLQAVYSLHSCSTRFFQSTGKKVNQKANN